MVALVFSTHDLSWRSTTSYNLRKELGFFQLTTSRGGRHYAVRCSCNGRFFNSRPLVEVDVQKVQHRLCHQFFNSRPLVEVDSYRINRRCPLYFSTHDLSWRSTAKLHNKSLKFCIFSGHFILEQMSLPFSYKYH